MIFNKRVYLRQISNGFLQMGLGFFKEILNHGSSSSKMSDWEANADLKSISVIGSMLSSAGCDSLNHTPLVDLGLFLYLICFVMI